MEDNCRYEVEKTSVGWMIYQHAIAGALTTSIPISGEFDTLEEAEAEIRRLLNLT